MTNEEAIEIINRENNPNDKKVWELFPEYREALDMAIQALSQESCNDAISREKVLMIASSSTLSVNESVAMIKRLPSVTQKSKTGYREYNDIYDHYLCGNCKTIVMDYDNFCPNCGAKMESEDKE